MPVLFDGPSKLCGPTVFSSPKNSGQKRSVTAELLQSTLAQGLHWYSMLANSIVEYAAQPELDVHRELASLVPSATHKARRAALQAAVDEKRRGKKLAGERDSKKRKVQDMSPTEQTALVRYEVGSSEKTRRQYLIKPHNAFRGSLSFP